MRHPDYPMWSIVGLILVLLPASWHFRAKNVATICLIGWQALANLTMFINSLVWADHFENLSPGWCDISGRIMLAVGYAIPACSLCQMRRLESVASTRRSSQIPKDGTQRVWTELALCVLFPVLMLPIHYLVQGHRYDVLENIGCSISCYQSWPGFLVRYIAPMMVSLLALIFAAFSVRWFLLRRLQFRSILANSQSGLTIDLYLRLIALAVTDVSVLVIFDIIALVTTFHGSGDFNIANFNTDIRWSSIHFNYGQVSQVPEEINSSSSYVAQALYVYMTPLYSIIFFIFFGFGEETIKDYISLGRWIKEMLRKSNLDTPHLPRDTALKSNVDTLAIALSQDKKDIRMASPPGPAGWTRSDPAPMFAPDRSDV